MSEEINEATPVAEEAPSGLGLAPEPVAQETTDSAPVSDESTYSEFYDSLPVAEYKVAALPSRPTSKRAKCFRY